LPPDLLVGSDARVTVSGYALVSAALHKEARKARCAVKELEAIPDS
jgi:hypothetical protein